MLEVSDPRDPRLDPRQGDVLDCYNDLLDLWITRRVISREGCTVLFSVGNDMYACCVDIWKMMCREGIVKSDL